MEHPEAPASKPLDLSTGDILLHLKSGEKYVVLDVDDHYYSEYYDPMEPSEAPLEVPMLHYQAMYDDEKKWFRPWRMFTEDRYTIIDNIYTV